jgi:hypothetical protein
MYKLISALAGLITLSVLMPAQKPSSADADALIGKSRQESLAYARSLPDFVCTEVISRYKLSIVAGRLVQMRGLNGQSVSAAADAQSDWLSLDKLTVKLGYFQQQESHQLTLVNGKPTNQTFESLQIGARSTGEFGGILRGIFEPASQTSFRWESWKTKNRRAVGLYAYQVEEAHSNYYLEAGTPGDVHRATVGFHGTLEIDRDTGEVLHLDHVADHIPTELGITNAVTEVDYDAIEVAGNLYLLPIHSRTELDRPSGSLKNEIDFHDYRKFEASSTVDYGPGKQQSQ